MNRYTGPPMTLGNAATARGYRVEPEPAAMAARYGAETTVADWRSRLVCGQCGSRHLDMVVSGAR